VLSLPLLLLEPLLVLAALDSLFPLLFLLLSLLLVPLLLGPLLELLW
jgi:hypothetical protein